MQCEGAGSLSILPTDLYAQDNPAESRPETDDRDRSFTILNVERAIALTMAQIKAQLEQPEQP
jgi:predicted nucleic acid-binding protein